MPDKQDRYRKRKEEQGFQRIELLVPRMAAPYLKAYARALRDAHALGFEPPLFEGLSQTKSTTREPFAPKQSSNIPTQDSVSSKSDERTSKIKPRPDFSSGLLD